ncbi:hypothetical protein EYR38_009878 [Pleurotus pulmonarius]|nr:hypothetical protein EYR38_009878 [Pleurotus pulmonarius]
MHPLSFHPYRRPDSAARTRIVRRRKSPEPEDDDDDNFDPNLATEATSGSVGPVPGPSQMQEEDACSTGLNDLRAITNTVCTELEDKLTCRVCLQIIKSPSIALRAFLLRRVPRFLLPRSNVVATQANLRFPPPSSASDR